jgi:hypothetical protein
VEYVFNPVVYGETVLKGLCMGSDYFGYPQVGEEARSDDLINFDQAFYKTADNKWYLGL